MGVLSKTPAQAGLGGRVGNTGQCMRIFVQMNINPMTATGTVSIHYASIVYFTLNLFQKAVNERDEALDTVRKSESVFINYLLVSFSQKKL